ncbi:MAG: threonine synthase [Janthinobacterium lividum]
MNYVSTRGAGVGDGRRYGFSDILLAGLAPDGGLFLPARYPRLGADDFERLSRLDYATLAFEIVSLFCDDIAPEVLRDIVSRTYRADVFGNLRDGHAAGAATQITPLTVLGHESAAGASGVPAAASSAASAAAGAEALTALSLLELSNGPTLAFKDLAMQLLGNLFEHALAKAGVHLNILGATSGDTGSAAEYAMRGKRGIDVFMLSPHEKMSAFQRAQMYSLQDPNIFNLAVRGVFDDCQDIVKAVSNDHAFKQRYQIGTVNSINWARVVAQIVYYFKGYFAAVAAQRAAGAGAGSDNAAGGANAANAAGGADATARASNEDAARWPEVSFAVPSGNFGNVCAGHIARMMGLPIRRLVVATNENDVLDEFFRSGRYRVRDAAETYATSSPSMDISKASNFERFVFDLLGRQPERVAALFHDVEHAGGFDLGRSGDFARVAEFGFVSGRSTHDDRVATIRDVWQRYGKMIDTHTADGIAVARRHLEPGIPMVVLETAQPVKFGETLRAALGVDPVRPAAFEGIEALPQRVEVVPADVAVIKACIARHAAG